MAVMSSRSALPPEHLVAELVGLLDEAPEIDDPADLEMIAGTLLLPISMPEVPEAARRVVVDAVAARADPIAFATLTALAVLAPTPLAAYAHEAAVRLAALGVTHPAAGQIGTLSVRSVAGGGDGDAEMIVAVLARPGSRDRQVLVLGIDTATDALVECMLTPSMPRREAEQLSRSAANDLDAPALVPIPDGELAARVVATAMSARDLHIALGSDVAPVLPVIARALTGAADGIAWPETLAPWEEDDEQLSIRDGTLDREEVIEELCRELEEHVDAHWPPTSPVRRHAAAVGRAMFRWRATTGEGYLGRWEIVDLSMFLLGHVPSCSELDVGARAAAPDCALAVIRFLAARGSLSGDSLPDLEDACAKLRAHARSHRSPSGTGQRAAKRRAQRSARKENRPR